MSDQRFMEQAFTLAQKGEGAVNPNPLVGAVVVKEGEIVGQGYHQAFGSSHAEVFALDEAGAKARDATLYVNLEPCSHHGKTPPCTDRILQAGIRRVVIATRDPNPLTHGRGVARLEQAGLEITEGVLEKPARRLNEIFFKFISTGLPFVQLKLAMSLDGKIATQKGDSKWISGEAARTETHRLRRRFASVLVGVETVIADDPELTVRHVPGRNPIRIVLDGRGRIPIEARLLHQPGRTIVVTASMREEKVKALTKIGVEVWCLGNQRRVDLSTSLERLGEEAVDSVLVEGGGETAASFLEADLVDKVSFFIAPLILGGRNAAPAVGGEGVAKITDGIPLTGVDVTRIGEDTLYVGYPKRRDT